MCTLYSVASRSNKSHSNRVSRARLEAVAPWLRSLLRRETLAGPNLSHEGAELVVHGAALVGRAVDALLGGRTVPHNKLQIVCLVAPVYAARCHLG
jgi:hypothetical protein